MPLTFLLLKSFDITLLTCQYVYSWGKYFIYGHIETTDEKINRIMIECVQMRKELNEIKNVREHGDIKDGDIKDGDIHNVA